MITTRSSTDPQQKTLLIKQDDKFFSRLLSRELSMNNTKNINGSFRGLPSSVPFTWESQPGTPKHHFHSGTVQPLPPLTPPPSYYSTDHSPIKRQTSFRSNNPIHTLFLKLNITKPKQSTNHAAQPSSPSMSWSSSSSTTSTTPCPSSRRRSWFGSWGGSTMSSSSCSSSSTVEEEDDDTGRYVGSSPTSTMCFVIRRRSGSQKKGLMPRLSEYH